MTHIRSFFYEILSGPHFAKIRKISIKLGHLVLLGSASLKYLSCFPYSLTSSIYHLIHFLHLFPFFILLFFTAVFLEYLVYNLLFSKSLSVENSFFSPLYQVIFKNFLYFQLNFDEDLLFINPYL